jgi:hypothetical protein
MMGRPRNTKTIDMSIRPGDLRRVEDVDLPRVQIDQPTRKAKIRWRGDNHRFPPPTPTSLRREAEERR